MVLTISLSKTDTGDPDNVSVCPSFTNVNGTLAISLTVTDNSRAPASVLTVITKGLVDNPVTINLAQPVLPMEAVTFPNVVNVSSETVNASNFTLMVNASNKLKRPAIPVYSSIFSYPPGESSACCTTQKGNVMSLFAVLWHKLGDNYGLVL